MFGVRPPAAPSLLLPLHQVLSISPFFAFPVRLSFCLSLSLSLEALLHLFSHHTPRYLPDLAHSFRLWLRCIICAFLWLCFCFCFCFAFGGITWCSFLVVATLAWALSLAAVLNYHQQMMMMKIISAHTHYAISIFAALRCETHNQH